MAHRSTVYCMQREVTVSTLIGAELLLLLLLPSWFILEEKGPVSTLNDGKTWPIPSNLDGLTERVVFKCKKAGAILFILHVSLCVCVCPPVSSLCLRVKGTMCGRCIACWSLSPPMRMLSVRPQDSDVEVSLRKTLRGTGAWGEFIIAGQSKLFSTPDEASHYWKNSA